MSKLSQLSLEYSRSKIDKAGKVLSRHLDVSEDVEVESEIVFDNYRQAHLEPMMQTTMQLQKWMDESGKGYYIAMRLKRRPQILRKLTRLSVRLTQLQDIAGARIILERNADVDETVRYLREVISRQTDVKIVRDTDYRDKGRDDSGYRARHIILDSNGYKIELQLRSKVQHYWAETIERTSVVYGHFLKELDGDPCVLSYFKQLSDVFYEFESNRRPTHPQRIKLDVLYRKARAIIQISDKRAILMSHPDKNVLKTLTEISEKAQKRILNNWILIFDWATGNFVNWLKVSHDPRAAMQLYAKTERDFPASSNFEVVLVGASDVSTIEQTHSHYFGIESYDGILSNLEESFRILRKKMELSIDENRVLSALYTRKFWGGRTVSMATIKNHLCEGVGDLEETLDSLVRRKLLVRTSKDGPVALNVVEKASIDNLMC